MTETNPFTEEALAQARSRLNKPLRQSVPFNEFANKDSIRQFADGYAEFNPLYRDEAYARKTRHGKIVAPPTFPYSCLVAVASVMGGIPGAHALWVGDEWEWFKPVYVDDKVTDDFRMVGMDEVHGKFASPMYEQRGKHTFTNQRGEVVCTWTMKVWRFARFPGKKRDRYEDVGKQHYTPEEIARIVAESEKAVVRGAVPRYWGDVKEGDSLGQVVKGPLTVTDFIVWVAGGGMGAHPFLKALEARNAFWKRHPTGVPPNEYGVPDTAIRVHWEDELARTVGAPAAYDFASQRVTWLAQVVTNWMGDDGFLKKLDCQIRLPNIQSDTTYCRGKVVKKYVAGGEHLVDFEVWGDNQRGQRSCQAKGTVALPAKR